VFRLSSVVQNASLLELYRAGSNLASEDNELFVVFAPDVARMLVPKFPSDALVAWFLVFF
jgi:hypothetical protein